MNWYQLTAYLKYWWKAKGRHGTHSPFVYAFVDEGMNGRKGSARTIPGLESYPQVVSTVVNYFNCSKVILINGANDQEEVITLGFSDYPPCELILVDTQDPISWSRMVLRYSKRLTSESIVLVTNIHHSHEHTLAWQELYSDNMVKLSMDLFEIGMLFFREEFREKEHFIVKAK